MHASRDGVDRPKSYTKMRRPISGEPRFVRSLWRNRTGLLKDRQQLDGFSQGAHIDRYGSITRYMHATVLPGKLMVAGGVCQGASCKLLRQRNRIRMAGARRRGTCPNGDHGGKDNRQPYDYTACAVCHRSHRCGATLHSQRCL